MKINDISQFQEKKLIEILNKNSNTEYGKKYDFKDIIQVSEYQKKLPITVYEDYFEYIKKIENGERNILTSEDILVLEYTSGSTSPSKLIPYTKSLKEEFQRGIKPWIYNLYTSYAGIKWGKSYWSITPALAQNTYTKGGIPLGFENDSEYLGSFLEKKLFDFLFAVPGDISKEKDIDTFYYKTALHLLMCSNLTFISIWNPTFLILLLEYIETNSFRLIEDILKNNKKRGSIVQELIQKKDFNGLWKHLKVISCWCDANAKIHSEKLASLFPNVVLQPKGLLATEGFISLPFRNEEGSRLSINSHFFEFLSIEDNNIYLAHNLEKGKEYVVIITTSGGFYRYNLNDIVEVTGFSDNVPLLKFKGKRDKVSDLFGEKLNEMFVKKLIENLDINPDFYIFAPEFDRYVLYIKADKIPINIDEHLRKNFHYDYCRKLGQFKELKIFKLSGTPKKDYLDACVKRGQRLGDIKPAVLDLQGGLDKVFKGEYI